MGAFRGFTALGFLAPLPALEFRAVGRRSLDFPGYIGEVFRPHSLLGISWGAFHRPEGLLLPFGRGNRLVPGNGRDRHGFLAYIGLVGFKRPLYETLCLLGLAWGADAWIRFLLRSAPFEALGKFITNPEAPGGFPNSPFSFVLPEGNFPNEKHPGLGCGLLDDGEVKGHGRLDRINRRLPGASKIFDKSESFGGGGLDPGGRGHPRPSAELDPMGSPPPDLEGLRARIWSQHLFLGNGPGVFDGEFQKFREIPRSGDSAAISWRAGYSHNEFLEFLTAFGLRIGGVFSPGGPMGFTPKRPDRRPEGRFGGSGDGFPRRLLPPYPPGFTAMCRF